MANQNSPEVREREEQSVRDRLNEIRSDIREPAIPLYLQPIREFFSAFLDPHTYKLHRNIHSIFGLLWGFPIPVIVVIHSFLTHGVEFNRDGFQNMLTIFNRYPYLYLFCLYPLISAFVFGAMGTIRRKKTDRIEEFLQQLETMSLTDHLTGLYNHRYIWMRLEEEIEEAKRHDREVSVLMCDLDGFKEINDNFGHDVGDRCLKSVGGLLRDVCREYDVVARYGGDEFVFILPDSTRKEAKRFAERISDFLDQTHPILEVNGDPLNLGLSIGVSTFPKDGPRAEDLMSHADEEMYRIKTERDPS